MVQLSTLEQICFSTTRIETCDATGKQFTGTGFFLNLQISDKKIVPLLVTNKHVVKGMNKGLFKFTVADSQGNPIVQQHFTISYETDFEKMWVFHPNESVDLCVLPINVLIKAANKLGKKMFYRAFHSAIIPNINQINELDAIEDIMMIGYPDGLWDAINNMPIVRKGITATQIKFDYEGKKVFLIDAAVFPGSSGSPVLLYNKGGYTDKNGNYRMGTNRLFLLGVAHQVFQHNSQGQLEIIPIQQTKVISNTPIPNNLGIVVKSLLLLDFISFFNK